jgi:hypothetical protein
LWSESALTFAWFPGRALTDIKKHVRHNIKNYIAGFDRAARTCLFMLINTQKGPPIPSTSQLLCSSLRKICEKLLFESVTVQLLLV